MKLSKHPRRHWLNTKGGVAEWTPLVKLFLDANEPWHETWCSGAERAAEGLTKQWEEKVWASWETREHPKGSGPGQRGLDKPVPFPPHRIPGQAAAVLQGLDNRGLQPETAPFVSIFSLLKRIIGFINNVLLWNSFGKSECLLWEQHSLWCISLKCFGQWSCTVGVPRKAEGLRVSFLVYR